MNLFLNLRLKIETLNKKVDKLYRENQVMKKRLLMYEKPGMIYYNNKKELNDNTQI